MLPRDGGLASYAATTRITEPRRMAIAEARAALTHDPAVRADPARQARLEAYIRELEQGVKINLLCEVL